MISESRRKKISLKFKVRQQILKDLISTSMIYGDKEKINIIREYTITSICKYKGKVIVELIYDDVTIGTGELDNKFVALVYDNDGNMINSYTSFETLMDEIYEGNKNYIHSQDEEEIEYMLFNKYGK